MQQRQKLKQALADHGFDADWYRKTYPDVSMVGMDPLDHFLNFGHIMRRFIAPNVRFDPASIEALDLPEPRPGRAILEAHEIARTGRDSLAFHFARRHVPQELTYTLQALQANAALKRNDQAGWLHHLNAYLRHFDAAPVHLAPLPREDQATLGRRQGEGTTLPERFRCAPMPAVTGGPLITVIMPAWNAERTVRAAARSILDQTWRNLELLIVDDFSRDGTWAELQRLASEDGRVKIFRNAVNVGPYVSKNIMLDVAKGAWITGHDADDWAHPQRLEQHMRALQQYPTPPRASVSFMLRLEPDGTMDRFAPVCDFSLDGVARDAAISCTYEAGFLKSQLGSWDCVRFGADSELISRTQALIGEEYKRLPLISMLCMNLEGSLTNNPQYGVTRNAGPSAVRVAYGNAWRAWHKTLAVAPESARPLAFPSEETRSFAADEQALVPRAAILRNHALHTGRDAISNEPVTAICASKRPHFAERVVKMMAAQTHENLQLIYVAHGPHHDINALHRTFAKLKSVQILSLPDPEEPLGAALNLALDHCSTDICAKIDDDDFYGPNYIRSSLSALRYSGHDGVGIVGRERAYVYVQERDLTAIRYSASHENSLRSRVYGGTIVWSRKILGDQRFAARNTGEDSDFFKQAVAKEVAIFSAEAHDYIHVRYADSGAHTWSIAAEDFLRTATPLTNGLRADFAFSTATHPRSSLVPGQKRVPGKLIEAPKFTALLSKRRGEMKLNPAARQLTSTLFSKSRMKSVVQALVPELKIPRTLAEFPTIEDFTPPEEAVFVLKPKDGSHSRGVFVLQRTDKAEVFRDVVTDRLIDRDSLIRTYRTLQEDQRTPITKACFAEEFVTPRPGCRRPDDFKFYCFAGKIGLILQKSLLPGSDATVRWKFWSSDWEDLGPVKYADRVDPSLPRPDHAEDATKLVAALSASIPVPFCRIDVYANEDGVFFGETTPFPNGGKDYFDSATDDRLAELWADAEARLPSVDVDRFMRAASGRRK